MRAFLTKLVRLSLFGIVPLALIGIAYIICDPFKVIYSYDSLLETHTKGAITLNKDYISTTTFIKNRKHINYNSFIFGNSRSIPFYISNWKKHLDSNAQCYHFDASGESLWAIDKKIAFIDKNGNKLENMLLILDYSTLIQGKPNSQHLTVVSPALVNYSNIVHFHKAFFFAFATPKFLAAFVDYKISGHVKPYMIEQNLFDSIPKNYDIATNELRFDYFEDQIRNNKYYTPKRLSVFYRRDTTFQKFSPKCILEKQKDILTNIRSITKKHNTDVRVVINPLYDQRKLNEEDLDYLKKLFGDGHVYDFSGINKFTNDYRNYYENSHYRPQVATEIMNIIYERE